MRCDDAKSNCRTGGYASRHHHAGVVHRRFVPIGQERAVQRYALPVRVLNGRNHRRERQVTRITAVRSVSQRGPVGGASYIAGRQVLINRIALLHRAAGLPKINPHPPLVVVRHSLCDRFGNRPPNNWADSVSGRFEVQPAQLHHQINAGTGPALAANPSAATVLVVEPKPILAILTNRAWPVLP